MKKVLCILVMLVMTITVAACSGNTKGTGLRSESTAVNSQTTAQGAEPPNTTADGNDYVDTEGISLDTTYYCLEVGQTKNLEVTFTPANASQTVLSYATANEKIATVSGTGQITGIGEGNTTITVTPASDSKIVARCNVTVLKNPVTYTIATSIAAGSTVSTKEKQGPKVAEQKTNVKIDWIDIPRAGWDEKVNIMFASGDLPDALSPGVGAVSFRDSLVLLNDLIDKYAPAVKELFEERPDIKKALTYTDGKIYSLPTSDETIANVFQDGLFVNKDWLTKLGLNMPTTIEEFYNVLQAFKTLDPNGNDKADEIPLAVTSQHYSSTLTSLFGSFGTLDNLTASNATHYVRVENGTVIFTPSEPGYLEALRFFNKLYSEKLMNQEYFTEDQTQFVAKGNGPETIEGFVVSWLPDTAMSAERAASYIPVPPLKGPDGKQPIWFKTAEPQGSMTGFVITTKCKNPEVLVQWYDFNNSSLDMINLWDYGPEGTGCWKKTDKGQWTQIQDNVPAGSTFALFRRNIATVGAIVFNPFKYTNSPCQVFDSRTQLKADQVNMYLPYAPKEQIPVGFLTSASTDRLTLLYADISDYMKKFKAQSIMNGITDAQWQAHLSKKASLKVDEYVKIWQDYYNSHK